MSTQWTICTHPDRPAIEAALRGHGLSLRRLAVQWSTSKSSLIRHRDQHRLPLLARQQAQATALAAYQDALHTYEVLRQHPMRGFAGFKDALLQVQRRAIAQRYQACLVAGVAPLPTMTGSNTPRQGIVHGTLQDQDEPGET